MVAQLITRDIEKEILPWIDSKEIIAIRGTRQSGKTTFLQQITTILREQGIPEHTIHFISFEDDIEREKFETNPREYIRFFLSPEKHYFLLDEIQYVKNAGKLLKLVYDTIGNVKIIITGSSTLDVNEVGRFLVGRVLLFEMHPFSFSEFLKVKDEKLHQYYLERRVDLNKVVTRIEQPLFLAELNTLLKEYITYGGYPAVVLEKAPEKKRVLLKNLFLTYIEKDVARIYGRRYRKRVSDLIKHIASINTGIVNYNELATLTGLYDKEIKEILAILEDTYVIILVRPFHRNLSSELRKNPKIYFLDTGLRNFVTGRFDFNEEEQGRLFENYVLNAVRPNKVNYWRTAAKAEVDFVIAEKIPIEVKTVPKITRSFRSFIDTYSPPTAFLANPAEYKKTKIGKTDILWVPLALL